MSLDLKSQISQLEKFAADVNALRIQRRGEGGKFVSLGAQRQRIDDLDLERWLKANGIKDEFIIVSEYKYKILYKFF